MRIGEFATRIGASPDTVRFWEKMGFFTGARAGNGYRVYTDDDVVTAELIASGKAIGFSLREIAVLVDELGRGRLDHAKVQQSLTDKLNVVDAQIAALTNVRTLILDRLAFCRSAEQEELQHVAP